MLFAEIMEKMENGAYIAQTTSKKFELITTPDNYHFDTHGEISKTDLESLKSFLNEVKGDCGKLQYYLK